MMIALYADGTPVTEGDRIRYRQTPGGLMAPASRNGEYVWTEGVAVKYPPYQEEREWLLERGFIDPDELHLLAEDGRYRHIAPHIIERLP